jgi:hypothetical protein
MGFSLPGLIGGLVGIAVGLIEYRIVAPIVVGKLRETEKDKPAAERAAFERKIGQFRAIFFVAAVFGGAIAGYFIGRALFA